MSGAEHKKSESALGYRLRAAASLPDRLQIAAQAIQASKSFDDQATAIICSEFEIESDQICAWLKELPESINTVYLAAVSASRRKEFGNAVQSWRRFFSLHTDHDPIHLLAAAQDHIEAGDRDAAAALLRRAMEQPLQHSWFARAAKAIDRVASAVSSNWRSARIALLGSSTTALLVPVMKALCLRDRINADFYAGVYGSITQEILDAQSGLAKFRPTIVFIAMNWRDLGLAPLTADPSDTTAAVVARQKALWERLSASFGCHVVQYGFDAPAEEAYGYLSASRAGGRLRLIEAINRDMCEQAPQYVSILDVARLQRQAGAGWQDTQQWSRFKQHPAPAVLPLLAEAQQAHIRAVLGLTRKVLVTDLDNTLWGGVIGEDGVNGIKLGPGSPEGEAHEELQKYLLELKSRGILLAVCSKNNPEDGRAPFEQHPHTQLKLDDFAAFVCNWEDKARNLEEIARRLSLGLDSFVLLDDNPLEREWVRSQLPQVAVPEIGPSVFHYLRELERHQYFFSLALSEEDLARAEQYRIEAQRETIRSSAASLEEFLAELQLTASEEPVSPANVTRVTQLANKTNQFNLTTRRYTEAEILQRSGGAGAWFRAFRLSDRMGSYGLVGLLFCAPVSECEWEIESWLMSCRVLGRQMEKFMFDCMLEAAAAQGIRRIHGEYSPTAKNGLVADLYQQLGFAKQSSSPGHRFTLDVPAEPATTATHVRDVSVRQVEVSA